MTNDQLLQVVSYLEMVQEEEDTSRRFKEKASVVIRILNSGENLCIDKALLELENLCQADMPSYQRTQVWDVISMLESMK